MTDVSRSLGANPRADKRGLRLAVVAFLALLFLVLHLGLGSTSMLDPITVLRELFRGPIKNLAQLANADPSTLSEGARAQLEHILGQNTVVWAIRLPKALYCILAGGILAVVGSAFQALFRNPLAEPFTIGVSSGAAVGGVVAQILGLDLTLAYLGTPLLGFAGGMASLILVLAVAKRRQGTDTTTLLLAGVVISSFLGAMLSLVILMSGRDTRQLMSWLLGSTAPQFMERVVLLAVVLVVGFVIIFRQTKRLNAFAIGEDTARRLGADPVKLRRTILIVGTAMAAAAVGTVGVVGFLGLVAPHLARRLLGVDWRWSLPGSLAVGSALMLAADALAQRFLPWLGEVLTGKELLATELPVGVVTAILGAPSLLILLRKSD